MSLKLSLNKKRKLASFRATSRLRHGPRSFHDFTGNVIDSEINEKLNNEYRRSTPGSNVNNHLRKCTRQFYESALRQRTSRASTPNSQISTPNGKRGTIKGSDFRQRRWTPRPGTRCGSGRSEDSTNLSCQTVTSSQQGQNSKIKQGFALRSPAKHGPSSNTNSNQFNFNCRSLRRKSSSKSQLFSKNKSNTNSQTSIIMDRPKSAQTVSSYSRFSDAGKSRTSDKSNSQQLCLTRYRSSSAVLDGRDCQRTYCYDIVTNTPYAINTKKFNPAAPSQSDSDLNNLDYQLTGHGSNLNSSDFATTNLHNNYGIGTSSMTHVHEHNELSMLSSSTIGMFALLDMQKEHQNRNGFLRKLRSFDGTCNQMNPNSTNQVSMGFELGEHTKSTKASTSSEDNYNVDVKVHPKKQLIRPITAQGRLERSPSQNDSNASLTPNFSLLRQQQQSYYNLAGPGRHGRRSRFRNKYGSRTRSRSNLSSANSESESAEVDQYQQAENFADQKLNRNPSIQSKQSINTSEKSLRKHSISPSPSPSRSPPGVRSLDEYHHKGGRGISNHGYCESYQYMADSHPLMTNQQQDLNKLKSQSNTNRIQLGSRSLTTSERVMQAVEHPELQTGMAAGMPSNFPKERRLRRQFNVYDDWPQRPMANVIQLKTISSSSTKSQTSMETQYTPEKQTVQNQNQYQNDQVHNDMDTGQNLSSKIDDLSNKFENMKILRSVSKNQNYYDHRTCQQWADLKSKAGYIDEPGPKSNTNLKLVSTVTNSNCHSKEPISRIRTPYYGAGDRPKSAPCRNPNRYRRSNNNFYQNNVQTVMDQINHLDLTNPVIQKHISEALDVATERGDTRDEKAISYLKEVIKKEKRRNNHQMVGYSN